MPKYRAVIYYEGFVETEIEADDETAAEYLAIAEIENFSPAELEVGIYQIGADITEIEEVEEDG